MRAVAHSENAPNRPAAGGLPLLHVLALWGAAVGVAVALISPPGALCVLQEGLTAAGMAVAACLAGAALVPWLAGDDDLPLRWRVIYGSGLGIGLLCLAVLGAGLCGLLERMFWGLGLTAAGLVGLLSLTRGLRRRLGAGSGGLRVPGCAAVDSLLLAPAAAMALLVATVPPGILWTEEARGYDVLEYHLQVPREYWDAGRIHDLPHNIYSHFPMNAEMLYLLAMVLRGDPIQAAPIAKLLNVLLGAGFAAAAWLAGREYESARADPTGASAAGASAAGAAGAGAADADADADAADAGADAAYAGADAADANAADVDAAGADADAADASAGGAGVAGAGVAKAGVAEAGPRRPSIAWACALLAGSAPWVLYGCGVAYVENGMLFFGMLAIACLCRAELRAARGEPAGRWLWLAGLAAGWSCGFKYTAAPMIAGAALLMVFGLRGPAARRLRGAAIFGLGTLMTFAPWLVKNLAFTGNPVFPLAYDLFGAAEGVWTGELAERWARAHSPHGAEASLAGRAAMLTERVLRDPRLGWWSVLLAAPAVLGRGRRRFDVLLLVMFAAQLAVWLAATHLYARFAAVLLIPLCVLGGRTAALGRRRLARAAGTLALLAVVAVNTWVSGRLYAAELRRDGEWLAVHGYTDLMIDPRTGPGPVITLRRILAPGERALMVGDARAFYMPPQVDYCVVFSRNPLGEAVGAAGSNPTAGGEAAGDAAAIRWLNQQGYAYVLVDWAEMERLRRTYGFWKELDAALFARLIGRGLTVVEQFSDPAGRPYATLFAVQPDAVKPARE